MKIRLKYLFSRKDKIGSKLISWASSKLLNLIPTPSHVAVLINDKFVFESTMDKGVHISFYTEWIKHNELLYDVECKKERDYSEIKDLYKKFFLKRYDFLGVLYFSYRFFLKYLFNIKIPKINKWQSDDAYFCCEAVGKLLDIPYEMRTPAKMYEEVSKLIEITK